MSGSVHSVRLVSTGSCEGSSLGQVPNYTLASCFCYHTRCLYHTIPLPDQSYILRRCTASKHSLDLYRDRPPRPNSHSHRGNSPHPKQQRLGSNILQILDWSVTKSFPHRTTLSLPSWNNTLDPCVRTNHHVKRDGWSRCRPFEAQPHQKSQGLQDLQTQTHSLRRDVSPMVRMLMR